MTIECNIRDAHYTASTSRSIAVPCTVRESEPISMKFGYLRITSKLVPPYFRGRRAKLARSRNSWNMASMRKRQLKLDINNNIQLYYCICKRSEPIQRSHMRSVGLNHYTSKTRISVKQEYIIYGTIKSYYPI